MRGEERARQRSTLPPSSGRVRAASAATRPRERGQPIGRRAAGVVDDIPGAAQAARRPSRRRDRPAGAQAGQAVRLCQAVRHDERTVEPRSRSRRSCVAGDQAGRVEIDLVDEHVRADRGSAISAERFERRRSSLHARTDCAAS